MNDINWFIIWLICCCCVCWVQCSLFFFCKRCDPIEIVFWKGACWNRALSASFIYLFDAKKWFEEFLLSKLKYFYLLTKTINAFSSFNEDSHWKSDHECQKSPPVSELFLCSFLGWRGFCRWSRTFWTGRIAAISFQIAWRTLFRKLYNGVWHQPPSCGSSKDRTTTVRRCARASR